MLPPINETDARVHRQRNWVATFVTLLVLGLIGAFVWRVLFLANQIRSGEVDPASFARTQTFTTNLRLAAIPLSEQPGGVFSEDDPSSGRTDAPLTIVEFADFGCPYSREAGFTMRELAINYPEKFRYIYRDFPITDIHPLAQKAAEAGECAAEQGRFWEYHDKLYQNQSDLSQDRLYAFAKELGLNAGAFRSCLDSGSKRAEVLEDSQAGLNAGVRGTPTFFLNGQKAEGVIPKETLEQWISSLP
ncbi:DsbA family protein [Candidatus Parcubacteria bacterium]|nr:DsbA family protein [Candidatus Parcubacteria bacterium]